MAKVDIISWTGSEYPHRPKGNNWYVIAAIIAFAACGISIYFGNYLFGIFIVVALFAFFLLGARPPRTITFGIGEHGVHADNTFYPYENLDSFWIRQEEHGYVLVFRTRRALTPFVFFHIDDADPNNIREVISEFLPETPHEKTLMERLEEYIGF